MNVGLYRTVAAMSTNQQRVEVISSNIANADATGFKRMLHVAHGAEDWADDAAHLQVTAATRLDMSQGVLKGTGNTLDLALDGDGFFVLEGGEGEILTRDGSFSLTEDGVLVNSGGFPVQWDGPRGTIDPSKAGIQIDKEGVVVQAGVAKGRLRLVNVAGPHSIEPGEQGGFRLRDGAEYTEANATVRQGFLERANLETIDELVELIAAQRAFESASQAFKTIDQSFSRLYR
ncbi:MAG: flagellar hook basal-body protein [Planctomycetota bacterium]|nr:flagellar hook basal-body protein [Planctomycetota bacterium]MDG1983128.1 flagellar hook basal-body protein [Planctomycetota bacterium]